MRVPDAATEALATWSRRTATIVGVAIIATVVVTMIARATHPFALEWMEGGVEDHVRRILAGRPLYGPPALRWTPFVYTPLYYYVCAAVGLATGPGLVVGRIVSILAFLVTLGLLYTFARRETGRREAGIVAAALYAGTYFYTEAWYDLMRMDSLALALLLWGVWLAYTTATFRGAVACGLVLFAAYFAKQTMLPVALPAVVYLALGDPRRGLVAASVLAAGVAGSTWLLDVATDGWYGFYVWVVPRDHVMRWHLAHTLWLDNAGRMTIAVLWTLGACAVAWRGTAMFRKWLLFAGTAAASAVVGITGLVHDGGGINAMMPLFASVSVVMAVTVGRLGGRWCSSLGWLTVVAQLGLLVRDPRPLVPDALDREVGQRIAAKLAAQPRPMWAPGYRTLAHAAGQRDTQAHTMALCDIFKMQREDIKEPLLARLERTLAAHQFSTIVIGEDLHFLTPRTKEAIDEHYELAVDVFWPGFEKAFLPPTGYRTHPRKVFAPDAADTQVWIGPP